MKILLSAATIVACLLVPMGAGADQPMTPYQEVLSRFVDGEGLVDYAGLKADRAQLDGVCTAYATADTVAYKSSSENDRMAFWINAYNVFTLKLIVDHYPIQPSVGKTKFPKNSIRQIPGAWEHFKFKALGREVTLDEIEHKILRVQFHDPRIHMALVCGAMACPPLRREPYVGERLDAQLDDQSRRFLSDLRKFQIDREAGEVWASEIFKWFVDDFLPGATESNPRYIAEQKSLTAFSSKYLSKEDASYLESGKYAVKYYEYDWTLNEQSK